MLSFHLHLGLSHWGKKYIAHFPYVWRVQYPLWHSIPYQCYFDESMLSACSVVWAWGCLGFHPCILISHVKSQWLNNNHHRRRRRHHFYDWHVITHMSTWKKDLWKLYTFKDSSINSSGRVTMSHVGIEDMYVLLMTEKCRGGKHLVLLQFCKSGLFILYITLTSVAELGGLFLGSWRWDSS